MIEGERRNGTAVLVTTHELTEVERLADRIVVLAGGRVVAAGTTRELTAGLRPRLRFRLDRPLDEAELADLGHTLGSRVVATGDRGWYEVVEGEPTPARMAALSTWCAGAGHLLAATRTSGGTLEEAYLELVGASSESTT
jgi:ABC-2 type transport system ATP-binding protein